MATATIVSFVPREITEFKPGLISPHVTIPAAPMNGFVTLHIQDNAYPLYLDSTRGSRLIPEPVSLCAEAIVNDFIIAQIEINAEARALPGLFWVYNSLSRDELKKEHGPKLAEAIENQTRWFQRLVRRADSDWQNFHQHNVIADVQRLAARFLNLERDWVHATVEIGNDRCPACSTILPSPMPSVCGTCQCILDEEKYKKFKFANA